MSLHLQLSNHGDVFGTRCEVGLPVVPERVDCETDDVLEFPLKDLLGDGAG